MHPIVQNRYDADATIAKLFPVDEVLLIAKKEAFNPKFCRDRPRQHLVRHNFVESFEKTCDVGVSLIRAPMVAGVLIDFIDTKRSSFLNANICQELKPYFAR